MANFCCLGTESSWIDDPTATIHAKWLRCIWPWLKKFLLLPFLGMETSYGLGLLANHL